MIIAHPERYREVVEAPDFLYRFARGSIYAQVNSSSLLGVFGERVKRTAEILFLHNMVQLIGSDFTFHRQEGTDSPGGGREAERTG